MAQRGALEQANLRIKRHFAGAGGGQVDYDRFTTMLANHYGQGETNMAACSEAAEIARAAGLGRQGLIAVAEQRVFPRAGVNAGCGVPEQATPIVLIAAATPAPQPVTLTDDVVAALAMLATFGPVKAAPAAAAVPVQLASMEMSGGSDVPKYVIPAKAGISLDARR